MSQQTVLGLLIDSRNRISAIEVALTTAETEREQLLQALGGLAQAISDVQAAVLHIQNAIGTVTA
jgi:hypothetical protein